MKAFSRILAAILALTLLAPAKSWAPTNIYPGATSSTTTSASSSTTGFGLQFYRSTSVAPCSEFISDTTVNAYFGASDTVFQTNVSTDGGKVFNTGTSASGFAAGSFGEMMDCFKSSIGLWHFMMTNSNGGFSTTATPTSTTWSLGPCGGGAMTAKTGRQGPNGTIIIARDNSTVCRSLNGGLTFTSIATPGVTNWSTGSLWSPSAGIWVGIAYNGANGTIMRSTDDGQSFSGVLTPAEGLNGLRCFVGNNVCIAATGQLSASAGIRRSTDGGATWGGNLSFGASSQGWGTNSIRTPNGMCFVDYGSGVVVGLANHAGTGTANVPGFRSTDYGVTWNALPIITDAYGGTNSEGIVGCNSRGGRALAMNSTLENVNSNIYSPAVIPGTTIIGDASGASLNLTPTSTTSGGLVVPSGQNQVAVYQGEGMASSFAQAWAMAPTQRFGSGGGFFNSVTTGAANTAVAVTIAAVANQRTHVYSIEAWCSAGTGTANFTIVDSVAGPANIHLATGAMIVATPASYRREWSSAPLTGLLNSTITITAPACGVGNTTTLIVQADRY